MYGQPVRVCTDTPYAYVRTVRTQADCLNPDFTSPTLSKGEEEHGLGMLYSVFRASAAPSPIGEGGGRGAGLPRRSYLTARNDDLPFSSHVSRHCEERSKPENHSIQSIKKNHSSDKISYNPKVPMRGI